MQNTVEFFQQAPIYTCLHFAYLISIECLLINIELGTPKGSWEQNASINHLNLMLCFRGLYRCVSTLCKNRPACFPKKRLHRNSESSLKYSVIFILGPYMYLLFILWASMCWQKENPCKCWYSVFIVTTFRYLSNCLFNVTRKILPRVLC